MTHDPMCPWGLPYMRAAMDVLIGAGFPCDTCKVIARVREDERAAALRDAVEAVKVSCSADIDLVERSEVIAAIEALGGEQ